MKSGPDPANAGFCHCQIGDERLSAVDFHVEGTDGFMHVGFDARPDKINGGLLRKAPTSRNFSAIFRGSSCLGLN